MKISILLSAGDTDADDGISVSTTLEIDLDDPRWQAWLVDSVAGQAKEGARQLRDEIIMQQGLPVTGFVPLCAVLPAAGAGR